MSRTFRRALVTGASSGIGAAFARELASRGTHLVVVARTGSRLEELATELRAAHGVEVQVLVADLVDTDDLARVEARAATTQQPVDLLVNNAGFGTTGAFVDLPLERELDEIRLNVVALVRLTHAALGRMRAAGSGAILNVSSGVAFTPTPGNATYGATKAFVNSFTEAVHTESLGSGVHVTAVCPGLTRTEFQERADFDTSSLPDFAWMEADEVARIGLDAVAQNRPIAVPGLLNKAMVGAMTVLPTAFTRRLAALTQNH